MKYEIIQVNNISKKYVQNKEFWSREKIIIEALKKISFSVYEGEIFGILGPNGAGKSTIIKIMSTILKEDIGEINILDEKIEAKIREKINIISGGERGLYWRLTGKENLDYFSELYGITGEKKEQRINDLLNLVELTGRENEKVEKYSKGMKQRLQIARGLINDPAILFLDEPTLGLDIISAKKFRELILKLSKEGKTIIFTTHYMKEAEEVCDRILFINKGEILEIGTIQELQTRIFKKKKIKVIYKSSNDIPKINNTILGIEKLLIKRNEISFFYDENIFDYKDFIKSLSLEKIDTLELAKASLEDLYIDIMEEEK